MKIAQVLPGLGIGGAELIACTVSDHLSASGHEVRLFSLTPKVLVHPHQPGPVIYTYDLSLHRPWGLVSEFLRFRRELADFGPDVIHTHLFYGNLLGRFANSSLRGTMWPLVSTVHNNRPLSQIAAWLYRITDSLCVRTVAVSEEARSAFIQARACPDRKSLTISNGIAVPSSNLSCTSEYRASIRSLLGASPANFLLVAVGRAVWEKNYSAMLHAFRQAVIAVPRLRLAIIGDGPELKPLKNLSRDLNIDRIVTFLGAQADARSLLPAADAFISTSTIEGFGLAIGEAMAVGLPVIGPRAGGVPDLIGECGWLCRPDSIESIVECIIELARMDLLDLQKIGASARARIQTHFSESTMNEAWESLLVASAKGSLLTQRPFSGRP